ncbi:ABC transporter ATP-binding protein [Myxococcota bacterium]|nr:ABC transporter ATP-binding protein [Myxococcota bacterium]
MRTLIELQDVGRSYQLGRRRVDALKGVSLTIQRGELISVVGPSGSGKTTLLNLLALVDAPTSGRVSFHGRSMAELSDDALSDFRNAHIGIVFQSFNLMPVLSARDNVALALEIRGTSRRESLARADELLKQVGLEAHADHRPEELSGGQRQRVAIARALVTRPDVVIADEPTAALDGATAFEIIRLMRDLNERLQTSFIFSTHDLRLLEHVQRRIELSDGMVAASDEVAA